ncbi:glycosyltransferase family 39 protein [Chitinophaga horti]|uniref:Glycosyltransferase family 39 protein n=1 Tax=Chitinophaga horti TaxID=2920382 RepID=A0ABY6J0L6_9BACT|nr:glycosyltransferase family 39 protein [Chitinophaga horti]UYQ91779.1 glycosyltransferase family 39 protein [Chitinophaga horti]
MAQVNLNRESGLLVFFLVLKIVLSFLLVNDVYELHRDEFLHLDQANHLAAGYVSVPPFTAFVSLLIKWLGNSEFWVRFFPALFGAATIFFSWKMVHLLGGNLYAKLLVAVSCLCSAYLRLNTLYQPNSFDVLAWTAVFYYLLVYFQTGKATPLYWLALWAGCGILNKYNILFLFLGLLPALVLTAKRKIFADRHFYFALLLMLVIVSPNLIWQVVHHFPVLIHMKELHDTQLVHVNRADFFIHQLLFFICCMFVIIAAFIRLSIERQHLWVLITYVATMLLFSFFNAKDYYALGLYPVLLAFGSVYLSQVAKRLWLRVTLVVLVIGSFSFLLPLIMPVYSPEQIMARQEQFRRVGLLKWNDGKDHALPQDYADMTGWRELATIVDSAYRLVPDKKHLLILCDNYGEAGAVNYYSAFGNIGAASFSADYANWLNLDVPIKTKIRVREKGSDADAAEDALSYGSMEKIGSVTNPHSLEYGTTVYLLREPKIDVNADLRQYIKKF